MIRSPLVYLVVGPLWLQPINLFVPAILYFVFSTSVCFLDLYGGEKRKAPPAGDDDGGDDDDNTRARARAEGPILASLSPVPYSSSTSSSCYSPLFYLRDFWLRTRKFRFREEGEWEIEELRYTSLQHWAGNFKEPRTGEWDNELWGTLSHAILNHYRLAIYFRENWCNRIYTRGNARKVFQAGVLLLYYIGSRRLMSFRQNLQLTRAPRSYIVDRIPILSCTCQLLL